MSTPVACRDPSQLACHALAAAAAVVVLAAISSRCVHSVGRSMEQHSIELDRAAAAAAASATVLRELRHPMPLLHFIAVVVLHWLVHLLMPPAHATTCRQQPRHGCVRWRLNARVTTSCCCVCTMAGQQPAAVVTMHAPMALTSVASIWLGMCGASWKVRGHTALEGTNAPDVAQ